MSEVVAQSKFLDLVKRSGLIEEERLTEFLSKVAAAKGTEILDDPDRLATRMVDHGLLTQWQADKLLAGKHKGFRLGKYKLLRQIGKGGMSSVYLAEHMLMKRQVAIKVLPQNRVEDASYLERFRLEARAVAKLDDPNIVRAYDIDNEGKVHYLVMEYVDGDDLHQIISKNGPIDFDTAADYMAQAANGLQHAHEKGLVHRDVKPANCLVDRKHTLKLLDLGLAKMIENDITSLTLANDENVLGTADYLAPEQALNSHTADSRADIYGLGCTLYFLLTGRPPFPEGTISERLLKHQTSRPDSIYKMRPDAPPRLIEICDRMMAKNPDDRYQNAGELAEVLTEWLAERGRKLGGVRIEDQPESGGIGSGAFKRFAISPPTPSSLSAPSSETLSAADRDTDRLNDSASGTSALDDIGLAPLDEEDEGVISHIRKSKRPAAVKRPDQQEVDVPDEAAETKPLATKSLVEEEFDDPQARAIAEKVAQRAKYNPLQPPGYTPRQSAPWGLWLALGGTGLLVLIFILVVVLAP